MAQTQLNIKLQKPAVAEHTAKKKEEKLAWLAQLAEISIDAIDEDFPVSDTEIEDVEEQYTKVKYIFEGDKDRICLRWSSWNHHFDFSTFIYLNYKL